MKHEIHGTEKLVRIKVMNKLRLKELPFKERSIQRSTILLLLCDEKKFGLKKLTLTYHKLRVCIRVWGHKPTHVIIKVYRCSW
jgi:hypothetical protein